MKMTSKLFRVAMALAFLLVPFAVLAKLSIGIEYAQMHDPWDGVIDIKYTVDGVVSNPFEAVLGWEEVGTGRKGRVKALLGTQGLPAVNGTYYRMWNVAGDEGTEGIDVTKLRFTASMIVGGAYLIVDLSGGPDAETYPISWMTEEQVGDNPGQFFNTDEYKTTKVVLRNITPGQGIFPSSFMMGNPNQTGGGSDKTGYASYHQVTFTKDFYCALFPTTHAQFENMTRWLYTSTIRNGITTVTSNAYTSTASTYGGAKAPVVGIGKATVEGVCAAIEERSGVLFGLLTEAQWEYVCRAGTTTDLYNGYDWTGTTTTDTAHLAEICWTPGTMSTIKTSLAAKGITITSTKCLETGLLQPNAWGFHDFVGNATEWCLDRWVADLGTDPVVDPYYPITYTTTTTNVNNKTGVTTITVTTNVASTTSMRGGSYRSTDSWNTSYYRQSHGNDCYATYHGFRLSITPKASDSIDPDNPGLADSVERSEPVLVTKPRPRITLEKVRQRYPWNGLVDVDYTIHDQYATGYRIDFQVKDEHTGRTVPAKTFLEDPNVGFNFLVPGRHRLVWNATNDNFIVFSRNVSAKIGLFNSDLSWSQPALAVAKFMIVDLETGAVSYVTGGSADDYNHDTFKTSKLVLRQISAGTCKIGSADSEDGRGDDELRHPVKFAQPFYVALFEMTEAQYAKLTGGTSDSTLPVANVSWADASACAAALAAKAGLAFDLPTEAQWECACRANTGTPWSNGQWDADLLAEIANVDGTAALPVGSKGSNVWGLYDTHGNVAEWCRDAYQADLKYLVLDPCVAGDGAKVVRGGSYADDANGCRSATRASASAAAEAPTIGFRVSVSVNE